MDDRRIRSYVATMVVAAVASLALTDWSTLLEVHWRGLIALIVLGAFAEFVAVGFTAVETSKNYSTITFIPFLAAVLLFGPAAAIFVAFCTIFIGEFLLRAKPLIKRIFNLSEWTVASALAGWVFIGLGGNWGVSSSLALDGSGIILPFFGMAFTLFLVNYLSVAGAITLSSEVSFRTVVRNVVGPAGANLLYGVLISPLAIVVAILYASIDVIGPVVFMLPLIFIRRSYQTNQRLKGANRDLLKALVKAIETRDPYTSGHSLRVSALARRIALAMNVPVRDVENIETAALLHDIGKIDAVYTGILRKPDSLSAEERAVIESHVTKGVELLESLSSLDSDVIAAVRYHHEREDGKGYPNGLSADEIPLGAKIIKVCDAVDAMLSDRPYRDALTLAQVREQLVMYAGTQFDVRVVQVVIGGDILPEHRADVRASQDRSPLSALDGHFPSNLVLGGDLRGSIESVVTALKGPRPRREGGGD